MYGSTFTPANCTHQLLKYTVIELPFLRAALPEVVVVLVQALPVFRPFRITVLLQLVDTRY
jgi:hypothetical protein